MRKNYLEKYKMNNKTELRQNWTISFAEKCIPARVPGDITLDLYNSGLIENPYYGLNHKNYIGLPTAISNTIRYSIYRTRL